MQIIRDICVIRHECHMRHLCHTRTICTCPLNKHAFFARSICTTSMSYVTSVSYDMNVIHADCACFATMAPYVGGLPTRRFFAVSMQKRGANCAPPCNHGPLCRGLAYMPKLGAKSSSSMSRIICALASRISMSSIVSSVMISRVSLGASKL
jgi:hypothetical protein